MINLSATPISIKKNETTLIRVLSGEFQLVATGSSTGSWQFVPTENASVSLSAIGTGNHVFGSTTGITNSSGYFSTTYTNTQRTGGKTINAIVTSPTQNIESASVSVTVYR